VTQTFVIAKEKELVPLDRTAERAAELVLHQRRLHAGTDERAICVQHRVSEIIIGNAVKLISAAADRRVDDGAAGPSILGTVVVGLNLELLDRVRRRNDRLVRIALVRALVRVVVDSVQLEVVHHRIQAVDVVGGVPAGQGEHFEQRLAHTRNKRRKIGVERPLSGRFTVSRDPTVSPRSLVSVSSWLAAPDTVTVCALPPSFSTSETRCLAPTVTVNRSV
jgi:hypothetical protein